jgi:uncharacterized protein YcbX
MDIHEIHIYPIKGMQGLSLQSSFASGRGFEMDRRLMLIDKRGKFVSQRSTPELTHFKLEIDQDKLLVNFKEKKSILISFSDSHKEKTEVSVWDSIFQASLMDGQYHTFFSTCLGKDLRLVSMQPEDKRKKNIKDYGSEEVSFADGYPFLFLGTASHEDLNSKLDNPIKINRFRANIILNTIEPFIEDHLDKFSIGEASFKMIKPCKRCQVITIDQETGVKYNEPLITLSTYRREDDGVIFGMNAICIKSGLVSVGDLIRPA